MDKLNCDQIFQAISVEDADLLPLGKGKVNSDNDPILPVLEYLREEIKAPQLELARAIQVPVPPRAWTDEEKSMASQCLSLRARKGWKIDGEKRKRLLEIFGKSDEDVIPVYLME